MKILKFHLLTLIFSMNLSYSQSKKEQIQILNYKIDSLNNVINNNNIKLNEEIGNLKKENLKLSNFIIKDKIAFEAQIKIKNDSIISLNDINKNLNLKIIKQKEIIELFNNALAIENREFDAYKDSKLFSQILILLGLYHFEKIDGYFSSTYYGVVLGNRLVNAKPTEVEKKIFADEVYKYLIYFAENYTDYDKKINVSNEEKKSLSFDKIVDQLNDAREFFEPYDFNKKYYLSNNIENILSTIDRQEYKKRRKLKVD